MEKFLKFMTALMAVGDRLREAGTWRLIAALASTAGAQFTDEQVEGVLLLIALALIVWEAFQPDAKTPEG